MTEALTTQIAIAAGFRRPIAAEFRLRGETFIGRAQERLAKEHDRADHLYCGPTRGAVAVDASFWAEVETVRMKL